MLLDVRLKTGFFETKEYELVISKHRLVLDSKVRENDSVTIMAKNISSIIFKNEKVMEIEVQTWEKNYQIILSEKVDFKELIGFLIKILSVKIICEYKGGK